MEIKFKNVTLLQNHTKKYILHRINFNIKSSGIYSFIGNSKSGKSAICEMIDFLTKPDYGSVKIGNYSTISLLKNYNRLRFNVGYVFEDPDEMFITTKVQDELSFGLKYFNHKYKNKTKKIIDSLKLVGLNEKYLNKKLNLLSLEDKKKVALASVLTFNPKILVLDEPTIGLNNKEKQDLIRMIKTLKNKYNKIIIIMSKDTDFVYSMTDYVYVMSNGEIKAEGKKDIMHNEKLLKENNLSVPRIVTFVNEVRKINKNFKYYDNVKDLAKGVYRDAR